MAAQEQGNPYQATQTKIGERERNLIVLAMALITYLALDGTLRVIREVHFIHLLLHDAFHHRILAHGAKAANEEGEGEVNRSHESLLVGERSCFK